MRHTSSSTTSAWIAGLILGLVGLVGCPAPGPPFVSITGHVTHKGKPLPHGTVSLRPVTAGLWDQPTGSIEQDGKYIIYTNGRAGAPPGDYVVLVMANEATSTEKTAAHPTLPRSILPARYGDPQRSPLRIQAQLGSATSFDLELTDESQE